MFDFVELKEGERVKIDYRHKSRYPGVIGQIVRADSTGLVVVSERSGPTVSVANDNIAKIERLTGDQNNLPPLRRLSQPAPSFPLPAPIAVIGLAVAAGFIVGALATASMPALSSCSP